MCIFSGGGEEGGGDTDFLNPRGSPLDNILPASSMNSCVLHSESSLLLHLAVLLTSVLWP